MAAFDACAQQGSSRPGAACAPYPGLSPIEGERGAPSSAPTQIFEARSAPGERSPRSAVLFALADGGLGGGQAGDRHAVGRAADVIQADALAELDRGRVAAMLAADAELDIRPLGPAALGGQPYKITNAVLVETDEGVLLEDALLDIGVEEPAAVVAADAEGGLGQVVGAEGEELGVL